MKPLRSSADLLANPQELRRRFAEDGYLYLPRLLPSDQVEKIAEGLCGLMRSRGWLDPEAGLSRAVPRQGTFFAKVHAQYAEVFREAYRLQPLMELQHAPEVLSVLQALFDERPFPLPTSLLTQYAFPRRASAVDWTTAPHQDYYGPQGSHDFCVVWTPLRDCPLSAGPLAMAEGSHKQGQLPVELHLHEFHGVQTKGDFTEQWRASDLHAGDVLIFNAFTVHKALPNDSDCIRLSASMKYQPESHPICVTSAASEEMHIPSLIPWEDLYAGFKGFEHERYWRRYQVRTVPRDMRFTADVFCMALRAATAGDPLAVPHLQSLRKLVAGFPRLAPHFVEVVQLVREATQQPLLPEDLDAMIASIRGQRPAAA